ncbi:MAG: RHS repeat-associated core domain-containing protein [Nitrospirae bacterium]|nr:RHS repeat-associated core domain-containing protein [Nitrospirota bacterium]
MTEPNGFYYMKARYYDPKVGRFISEDPIGFEGGDVNLMAYVGNNPLLLIDPLGLQWLRMAGNSPVMGSIYADPGSQPGDPKMEFFEFHVPNIYETSKQHDAILTALGIENPFKNMGTKIVNAVTMPIAFVTALITNIFETITGTEETIFGNRTNSSQCNGK